jgi:hypothetical protein
MKPPLPSNRSFGWTFTGVFALGAFFYPWVLALAGLTALVTLTRAQWLAPLNRAWMKFGELMHHVVAIGNCFLRKEQQNPALKKNYASAFELD